VDKIGQGRVWSGERARQLGLVDELGGLDTAIAAAKTLAKIPPSEPASLIYLPPPRSLVEKMRDLMGGMSVLGRGITLRKRLEQIETLARTPAWTLLPVVPEVQ